MDDLKSVTVSYLRELAQKHLGSGYSKLKKEELIAALAAYVPALARLAKAAGITVARKSSTTKRVAPEKKAVETASKEKAPRSRPAARESKEAPEPEAAPKGTPDETLGEGRVSAPKRVAAKRASEKPGGTPSARPAQVVTFPPKPRGPREPEASDTPVFTPAPSSNAGAEPPGAATPPAPEAPATPPPPVVQHDAEPLVEGFFVARVAGEDEARRHHLVEARQPPPPDRPPEYNEGLGGLPVEYHDDSALLLPRDPQTLFVSWDFSPAARNRALQGLESPRAVLRVFDGEKLAREQDCVLETRGFYIHGLPPGRPYRVEVLFVGQDGRSRRIGHSSNRVTLPPSGTSTDHTVRFLRVHAPRMPEPQPLPEVAPPVRANASEVEEREYISWRRVNLPGSAGVQDLPESRRERTGSSAPAESHLEAMPRPAGASDQRYVESRERVPGASDQRYVESMERVPGASDQRYVESMERVPGASDQRYLTSPGRAPGASDQRYLEGTAQQRGREYLDVGRAPGASDMRYLESPPRAPGASDMRYQEGASRPGGAAQAPHQYLDIGRAPGASDMRYLDSPGRAPGASDMRYLDSQGRVTGASDQRYLESPPRAPGASDMRYLDSPPRAPGASDMRYLESPSRAPGASDQRYLEYVARPPGASDQRYADTAPRPQGSSDEEPLPRKPPSGSGRS